MRKPQECAESVTGEVALTPTPLPGDGHRFLEQPGGDGLDGAAHGHNLLVLRAVLVLERPSIFDVVQSKISSDYPRKKRHEGTLLQLIDEDGRVRLASRANGEASGGVPHSNGQTGLGS